MAYLPLISIIIPLYNVEEYIEECLYSLINQSYNNLQILLINDGSTDRTSFFAKKIAKVDSRIHFINKKQNTGPGATRNAGLRKACGKYILFIDADDYLEKDTIEILVSSIPSKCDIYIFNGNAFLHETKQLINTPYFSINPDWCGKQGIYKKYKAELINFHSPCLKMYSTSFIKTNKIKFPINIYGEDVEFWLRCLLNNPKLYYQHCFGYKRRIRQNSIMTGDPQKSILDRINNLDSLLSLSSKSSLLYNYFVTVYIPFLYQRVIELKNDLLIEYFETTYKQLVSKYDSKIK